MKNSHLEKLKRNQRIRQLLATGWTQSKIAEEYNISVQRVNDLVAKFTSRRLLKKTKNGFVIPKGRAKKLSTSSPQDNYQNSIQDKRLDNLEHDVKEIKDNHIPHIIKQITKIGTDVDWLKRFFWIVITASIGGLLGALINLAISLYGS